ncbi:restriction endonuclease subunit S [Streptomyces scabiei]|uniref:restriction endonuclease subunit S n=1 Tax=Streptomyces scabiei TaxID=1930 RepID=UPI0033F57D15
MEIQWTEVRNVGDVRMGKQLSPAARDAPGHFPYLRVANVHLGRIDYADVNTMGFTRAERETYGLKPGDILLNEGQSLELVGRSAIYDGVEGEFCFQNTLIRFRPGADVLPAYAQMIFERWLATGAFAAIAKQTTSIAHLGGDRFGALLFPLIPVAAQWRIVDVVDSVTELERGIEASIAKLRSVRQGTLLDFMSRIQPEWRPVRDLGEVRMGKQLSPDSRAAKQQFPYLRVANVHAGRINYSDVKTMGFTKGERSVYGLIPGDILLNEGQSLELVGRSAIYSDAPGQFFFQNTLVRFRPDGRVTSEYAQIIFEYWLQAGVFAGIAKKTTSIAHLGGERFAGLDFPLVSLAEQQALVTAVSACDTNIATESGELNKLRHLKDGLVDDLLSGRVAAAVMAA